MPAAAREIQSTPSSKPGWVQACVDATMATPVNARTQGNLLCAISLFGGVVHDPQLFKACIPEGLMQESKYYQLLREEIIRENTTSHILVVLKAKFPKDVVNVLAPVIRNISDVQRLEELLVAATRVQNIEAFAHMLNE